jgi:hypothetical protein
MPNVSVGGVSGIWLNATYAAAVPEMTMAEALRQQPVEALELMALHKKMKRKGTGNRDGRLADGETGLLGDEKFGQTAGNLFSSFSAACFYFGQSLTDELAKMDRQKEQV